jgi:hypothetical protein
MFDNRGKTGAPYLTKVGVNGRKLGIQKCCDLHGDEDKQWIDKNLGISRMSNGMSETPMARNKKGGTAT